MTAISTPAIRAALSENGPVPTKPWILLQYDVRQYPFAALLIRDIYRTHPLSKLHEHVQKQKRRSGLETELTAQDNLDVRKRMQDLPDDAPFILLYHSFMKRVLSPLVGQPLSYSSRPKMRIHFPQTKSVSSFHHDIIVTKRIDQVNFWMPFTDVSDSATLWIESDYGRADYAPVPVRYGEVLIFDGGYIGHGSVANETETTRVSLDMRFAFRGATTRAEGVALMNRVVERIDGGFTG